MRSSANARWDNHVAILTGDFLFSKSSELTAELGADAVRIQAQTFTRLVEGQILETVEPGPGEDPLAHYLDVVAGKTGSLIATSARYGARFGGASAEVEEALTAYGEIVGSAFQLSDDILDIASDHDVSGKTPGTDLREGVPTLPVLMARASTDPADARLLELLDGDLTDDARHAEALALLRRHPRSRAGPRLRRRPGPGGQGPPHRPPRRPRPPGPRGLRRRRRHPLLLTPSRRGGRNWRTRGGRYGDARWQIWRSGSQATDRHFSHLGSQFLPPRVTISPTSAVRRRRPGRRGGAGGGGGGRPRR